MEPIVNNFIIRIKLILSNENHLEIFKFLAVGVLNTLVDISVAFVLNGFFGIYYVICQIAGYSTGTLNSFFLNKFFTFKNKGNKHNSLQQFLRFIVINLISLGATLLALRMLMDVFLLNFYISKVIVTFLSLFINYIGSKFWVFRK
jgi:putative flippase GtrA